MSQNIEHAEKESAELTDSELLETLQAEASVSPISYMGTDFDVDGLVRRLNKNDIVIPNFGRESNDIESAGFQRDFVWRRPQMDRFIESLLLGFPIPAIMLVQQTDRRYLVLDGQQRLRTLQDFYEGVHRGREFRLVNVVDELKDLSYSDLSEPQRRTLDNTFIQATIVRSDGSDESLDAIYQIFERLNSGGTQLTAHEIRIALYSGSLVSFLDELNAVDGWRSIYGPVSPRLRDREVILRIIALYSRANEYYSPLKQFLNKYMADHRQMQNFPQDEIQRLFIEATTALDNSGVRDYVRRRGQRINVALLEAVVTVYMRRVRDGLALDQDSLTKALSQLGSDSELEAAVSSGTTTEDNVRTRLRRVSAVFETTANK